MYKYYIVPPFTLHLGWGSADKSPIVCLLNLKGFVILSNASVEEASLHLNPVQQTLPEESINNGFGHRARNQQRQVV